jgi:Mg2+ and Co2+ transporter CorA
MSSLVPSDQFPLAPLSPEEDPHPIEDDVKIDDEDEMSEDDEEMEDDVDEIENDDGDEDNEDDHEVPPAPPLPAISDVTYESDTSEALGHALGTEVLSTFKVGESSTTPRVTPLELREELTRLRQDITWCQGRYGSMCRRLGERQTEVAALRREVQDDCRVTK